MFLLSLRLTDWMTLWYFFRFCLFVWLKNKTKIWLVWSFKIQNTKILNLSSTLFSLLSLRIIEPTLERERERERATIPIAPSSDVCCVTWIEPLCSHDRVIDFTFFAALQLHCSSPPFARLLAALGAFHLSLSIFFSRPRPLFYFFFCFLAQSQWRQWYCCNWPSSVAAVITACHIALHCTALSLSVCHLGGSPGTNTNTKSGDHSVTDCHPAKTTHFLLFFRAIESNQASSELINPNSAHWTNFPLWKGAAHPTSFSLSHLFQLFALDLPLSSLYFPHLAVHSFTPKSVSAHWPVPLVHSSSVAWASVSQSASHTSICRPTAVWPSTRSALPLPLPL